MRKNDGDPSSLRRLLTVPLLPGVTGKRAGLRVENEADRQRDQSFRRVILSIPAGKVSTYGKVAAAAGYPLYHRAVARLLRSAPADLLPWHRVVGAGGQIKLHGAAAREQKARLRLEGVMFRGDRVAMPEHEWAFATWNLDQDD